MSRPRFPIGVVLPASCISRIRSEQEYYDRDPDGYERREQARHDREEEEREMERMMSWEEENYG